MSNYPHFVSRAEDLYAALKHLTEEKSTARQVVSSTPGEDGFLAWWSLNSTFTQALAGRQGAVMNQFTASHSKPAKNTNETKAKLIEVDNAIKKWQEVMGESVPEQMLRTAYVGILDPLTRQHHTNSQGKTLSPRPSREKS